MLKTPEDTFVIDVCFCELEARVLSYILSKQTYTINKSYAVTMTGRLKSLPEMQKLSISRTP